MKKFVMRALVLCISFMLLSVCQASVKLPSPGEEFYYLDQPGVLTRETEAFIFFNNESLEDACGAQIAIVVVNNLSGMQVDDYAYALMNEWGVGDKDKDNGIMLVMAIQEDTYYASRGTGTERIIDAGTLQLLLDTYLEPDFAKKDYDAGAGKIFGALFQKISSYYGLNLTLTGGEQLLASFNEQQSSAYNSDKNAPVKEKEHELGDFILGVLFLGAIFLLMALAKRAMIEARGGNPVGRSIWTHRSFGGHHYPHNSWGRGSSFRGGSSYSSRSGGYSGSRSSFGSSRGGGGSSRGGGAGRR